MKGRYASVTISPMAGKSPNERVLALLDPYRDSWNGTLHRGDLVIPQQEVAGLVRRILDTVLETTAEASDHEVFEALRDARARASVQDQVVQLRRRFVMLPRSGGR